MHISFEVVTILLLPFFWYHAGAVSSHPHTLPAKPLPRTLPRKVFTPPPARHVHQFSALNKSKSNVESSRKFFPPYHNKVDLQRSRRQDVTWSEHVQLPNPLIKNWHLLLKNVSYTEGVLNIHLPSDSKLDVSRLQSLYKMRVVHSPLDMASCSSLESRRVTHVFPGWSKNPFLNNLGHFHINILNPLFRYLFFVHDGLPNLVNASAVPSAQLPLSNTLLLIKSEMTMEKPPVFLFDVVLRFASSYMHFVDYFGSLEAGGRHCFESIDVPIYDPVDHQHPEKTNVKLTYGLWDSMHFSLKGRWGNHEFYYNFWRHVKHQIWQLYEMMPSTSPGPIPMPNGTAMGLVEVNTSTSVAVSPAKSKPKPKLAFMARPGNSRRNDGNVGVVSSVLGQDFDVTVFGDGHYKWHATDEAQRFRLTRSTLLKVQQADIMLGQSGSNNQLALFMREGCMVVEMKNYGPCNNEGAKNLANHNRLAFHTLMITNVGVPSNLAPVQYSRAGVKKLSGELLAAWRANLADAAHESRLDSWPSTCDFMWPHQDPWIQAKTTVMTRANVSRCYLERVPGRGWYQLATHKNSFISGCFSSSEPYSPNVAYCMISGVC